MNEAHYIVHEVEMKFRAPGRVAHSLICTSYNEHTSEREIKRNARHRDKISLCFLQSFLEFELISLCADTLE